MAKASILFFENIPVRAVKSSKNGKDNKLIDKSIDFATNYLQKKFDEIKYPAWHMPYSNTVFFKRPERWIQEKYSLANGFLPQYGGELSHIVVMQHVKKNVIDDFIEDITRK